MQIYGQYNPVKGLFLSSCVQVLVKDGDVLYMIIVTLLFLGFLAHLSGCARASLSASECFNPF